MVQAGDDLAALLSAAMARAGLVPQAGDVLAIAQKIVSKAEGRSIALASVQPSAAAHELAEQTGKRVNGPPDLAIEICCDESRVREHRQGRQRHGL